MGGGCEAAALACGRVGRECDAPGPPDVPAPADRHDDGNRQEAAYRKTHHAFVPIRPERPPPLVRHAEHHHFAIAERKRKPARASFAARSVPKGAGVRGVTPKRESPAGRPPTGEERGAASER